MPHITLTPEQMHVARAADGPVEVRDAQGRTVAQLTPLATEDIEAVERSKRLRGTQGPRVGGDQVQSHLQRLGELRQQEDLDETKMLDMLRRMRAGETV